MLIDSFKAISALALIVHTKEGILNKEGKKMKKIIKDIKYADNFIIYLVFFPRKADLFLFVLVCLYYLFSFS